MQIYADVTGLPIYIPEATQIGALGSAMHGALAAGSAAGGYNSIVEASAKMARLRKESYHPIPENRARLRQALRGVRPAARLLWPRARTMS